jgi:hypothetical protein
MIQACLIDPVNQCVTHVILGKHNWLALIDEIQQLTGCNAVLREVLAVAKRLMLQRMICIMKRFCVSITVCIKGPFFGKGVLMRMVIGAGGSTSSIAGNDRDVLSQVLFYNEVGSCNFWIYFTEG